jgi:hypothetical protein
MSDTELHAWLGVVFKRLITGKIEPAIATAAASVAKAMITVEQAAQLEARVAELERDAGITTGSRWTA